VLEQLIFAVRRKAATRMQAMAEHIHGAFPTRFMESRAGAMAVEHVQLLASQFLPIPS
jgi:hypothetical protein